MLTSIAKTTIFVAIGVSSNLAVATGESQHPGIYQNMYWGWGLAVMLGIYISGGSSGAHLNPAVSIPLWIYVSRTSSTSQHERG